MSLVITGTPGVGKHTIAEILAKDSRARVIDLGQEAERRGIIEEQGDVDTDQLRGMVSDMQDGQIIVGHLAPYVLGREQVRAALILRKSPYELAQVYRDRGYSKPKAQQNLQSEILGITAYDAAKSFGADRAVQIDATVKSVPHVAKQARQAAEHKIQSDRVDWLSLVAEKGDIMRYFEDN